MTPCPFLGDAQRRPVTFYLTPNVTVHSNRRGNYAARTFPLFYSTAFVIVIRLVYKNLRYWPIRIYFGRLAIDCCINSYPIESENSRARFTCSRQADKNMAAISCLYFGSLPFYKDWINVRLRLCYCCSALCLTSWGTLVVTGKDDNCSGFSNAKFAIMSACRLSCPVLVTRERVTDENQNAIVHTQSPA